MTISDVEIRDVAAPDRAEWLRMLLLLHPASSAAEHEPSIVSYFTGADLGQLIPAIVFVADRGEGRLGGFLELSLRPYAEGCTGTTPYVESWFVDEDLRGAGVGRSLMHAAEAWARERGHAELASDALLENELSHAAHRALGFEVVDRIVVFRKPL